MWGIVFVRWVRGGGDKSVFLRIVKWLRRNNRILSEKLNYRCSYCSCGVG
jgi:hypothetical protein